MRAETGVLAHVRSLVEIGPRPAGSEGHRAAAGYIAGAFAALGLEVERQAWPLPAWQEVETRLQLGGEALPAAANGFSPPCDVTAPLVAAGTLAELEAADLAGCVAVLYGDLTREPLAPKASRSYNPPQHQRILALLEAKGPAAVITVNPNAGQLSRVVADWELALPSATVPAEAGLRVLAQAGQALHLRIESRRTPAEACNVVARQAGRRRDRIVLCAHYDTAIDAPGAIDNASGLAVLLALAERLAGQDLALGLELVAFGDEDGASQGDEVWLRSYGLEPIPVFSGLPTPQDGERMGHALAAINVDGVGQAVGVNTVMSMAGSEAFAALVAGVAAGYPGVNVVDPWPASNHYTFYSHGVPSIAIGSTGVANVAHTPADTIEWISLSRLEEAVALATELVAALQDRELDWCREARATG